MNESTLKKLKNNPHYKMNAKERAYLDQLRRREMTDLKGNIVTHNSDPVINKPKVIRRRRGKNA